MKGQNIEKYQQNELNLMFKPDQKQDKMLDSSRENCTFGNELLLTSKDKIN